MKKLNEKQLNIISIVYTVLFVGFMTAKIIIKLCN